ncbi:MAG: hypothetical protein M1448_00755 [Candidatus Marsarchaeota archaeon]|nr:hypothetical protein [Candidatus Marsarchaeota archaeon]
MEGYETVLGLFSGMVTKEQAMDIASGKIPLLSKESLAKRTGMDIVMSIDGILGFVEMQRCMQEDEGGRKARKNYNISAGGEVYRIFNTQVYSYNGKEARKRVVVLGKEGNTMNFTLFDEAADMIDSLGICRGDTIVAKGVVLDVQKGEMKGLKRSRIKRCAKAGIAASLPEGDMRGADIFGIAEDIRLERYTDGEGKERKRCLKCSIRGMERPVEVFFFGSSADAAGNVVEGDEIRAEFCTFAVEGERAVAYAGENSRVMVTQRQRQESGEH